MLNDWEKQQLDEIERELRSDPTLDRVLSPPTRLERRWLRVRRFSPLGFLGCALVYMAAALGVSNLRILAAPVAVVACAVWILLVIRTLPRPPMSR